MARRIVLALILMVIVCCFAYSTIMPSPVEFPLKFIKRGESSFGLYSDSSCTTAITTVDFELLSSVSETATSHTNAYIGWTVYEDRTNYKIRIHLAGSQSILQNDLSNPSNTGYSLIGQSGNGLNYSLTLSGESGIPSPSEENRNKEIPASERQCEFSISGGGISGYKELKLTIQPPRYEGQTQNAFIAEPYSGYIVVTLLSG